MANIAIISKKGLNPWQLQVIQDMAALNFSPSQIATYLTQNNKMFLEEWNKSESEIRHAYDKGILQSQYQTASSMSANARSGNITAFQIFEKTQDKILFENHKNRVFNEG